MVTYVLIHGAGSDSWYWHRVIPELRALGHDVVAPDLPCDDDTAGFCDYADVVVDAIGDRTGLIVVAQSLAGFTAPLVCDRVPADLLVLLAAMVPSPGESGFDWWANTGHADAMLEQAARGDRGDRESRDSRGDRATDGGFDVMEMFFHDAPPDVVAEAMARGERRQSGAVFVETWPLTQWPDVPTRFLLCRDDRFFPAEFQRRVVKERLGITPDEMDGGHLPALSHPKELVDRLEAYRTGRPYPSVR
jgi:pimeloyl-ACP methyl ester carboxylesterase